MSRGVPILLYHRVGPRNGSYMDRYTVAPETFALQMKQLSTEGWVPVPLENLVRSGFRKVHRKAVVITFDDGFACNRAHAWPTLRKHRFPSSTFIVTRLVGSSNVWDPPAAGTFGLLSRTDMKLAQPGLMSFHSHSATHVHLPQILPDGQAVRRELVGAREDLEQICEVGCALFAYPFGSWDYRSVRAVRRAGYKGACTCMEGLNHPTTSPFLLRRVAVNETDLGWKLRLKLFTGRELTRWPRERLPEIKLIREWIRKHCDLHAGLREVTR